MAKSGKQRRAVIVGAGFAGLHAARELDPRLSKAAERVLRRRGVEVRTGQSVAAARTGTSS